MNINIENESKVKFEFDYMALIHKVIEESLDYINCPYDTIVNVLLTDNNEIEEINNEYRQIHKATDVLSFPMLDYKMPGDFTNVEEEQFHCFEPDTGQLILGDIVVSNEKVYEQAEEFGHAIERELAFLIAHSMFHLFGYDHMEENEQKEMEKMQEEVLTRLNIKR